jgi:hypothetical protein
MDSERREELRQLNSEERRRRLDAGLSIQRAQRQKVEKETQRRHALDILAPVLSVVREVTNKEVNVLEDDSEIVAWVSLYQL